MNPYKFTALLLILFCANNLITAQIQNQPQTYRKINFMYQQQSNVTLTDKGIYADTLLLKKHFPEMIFPSVNKEEQSVKTIGFIPFSELNELNKKKLIRLLSHDNVFIKGVYDVKKNKVNLVKFSDLFDFENSDKNRIVKKDKIHIDKYTLKYLKNHTKLKFSSFCCSSIEDINKNRIEWTNKEEGIGLYNSKINNILFTAIFEFSADLPKFVSPTAIFSNSEYGVKNVDAKEFRYRLLSVSYE